MKITTSYDFPPIPDRSNTLIDMVGFRSGRITVLSRSKNNKAGNATWKYQCDCGNTSIARGIDLRRLAVQSCGCVGAERMALLKASHGHAVPGRVTRTYRIWMAMRRRCNNPNTKDWKYYGGRGVTVCAEWSSYEVFLADMGEAPPGLSIDRIDNEREYSAGNCRWATQKEQVHNSRRTIHNRMET